MDVIGHDHPRVQLVMSNFDAVFHRSKNQLSNARLSEEGRATPGLIEQPVHRDERLAGGQIGGRKGAILGKTAMQPEGDEQGLAEDVEMREPAPFQYHTWIVRQAFPDSPGPGGLGGRRRPRACPTNVQTPAGPILHVLAKKTATLGSGGLLRVRHVAAGGDASPGPCRGAAPRSPSGQILPGPGSAPGQHPAGTALAACATTFTWCCGPGAPYRAELGYVANARSVRIPG
jgi:hypothetical protein